MFLYALYGFYCTRSDKAQNSQSIQIPLVLYASYVVKNYLFSGRLSKFTNSL